MAWSPALLTVALTAWLLLWHHSLVIVLGFSARDFQDHLLRLAAGYFVVALGFSLALHIALCRSVNSRRATRLIAGTALAAFLVSGVMRVLDWGTFYYSAGHVDEDFWASAFYRQNLGFASVWMAWWPVITLVAATIGFGRLLGLARRFAVTYAGRGVGAAQRRPTRLLLTNAMLALAVVGGGHLAWRLLSPPQRPVSQNVRLAFAGLPEYKVLEPLFARALQEPPTPPDLDARFLAKLEQAGIRLGTVNRDYPLLKPSIFLDARSRSAPKPAATRGMNVIVILSESLSADLLNESVHGVKGLTPNFNDFAASATTFKNLYCADFPTIKGQIASLASFAFDHRGLTAGADGHHPLESRYLFLSDVLKRQGYTTAHVQSDFGRFANTAAIFGRHQYDTIESADDAVLLTHAQQPLKKTWGIFDRDLYSAIDQMLDTRRLRSPFLMTVATTDMHFPYVDLKRHPGANGCDLLDAVYTEDQAFGVFWRYFKGSALAANTIVLVTADHSLVRRAIREGGADPTPSEFDYVAAMLYVPGAREWAGRRIDTTCTQLDLAPTLLDVLGIDTPNPYLGLSIFSERPLHPLALGREVPLDRLSPADRATVRAIGWTDADQGRYLQLLRYLAVTDHVMPPQ
ncbi:MAG: LTA synthase family protein [Bacteroidales bacterium]